jgi:hypothetical protein
MKAEKAIRLMKTVDPLAIRFRSTGNPYIDSVEGYNNGWTLNSATQTGPGFLDTAVCTWEDTIDIAGLAANDISLINQGGAVARCTSPIYDSQQAATLSQMTIVSVNPIEIDYLKYFRANALSTEGNLQDYFMATTQEFNKSTQDSYILAKVGEHNFGTGGIAQATKLYVKSIAYMTVLNNADPTPPPVAYDNPILAPPVTIAIGGITAELDPVQMAAAIYRANDQE